MVEHGRLLAGEITTSDGQTPDAFKPGQYGLVDFLYYPAPNVFLGPDPVGQARELPRRLHVDDFRIQFSAKYSFKHQFGGK